MKYEDRESSKKVRELRAIETLRAIEGTFPRGELVPGQAGEEPDFVIKTDQGTFGFEVTEYFTPNLRNRPSLKAREPLTDQITLEATRQCCAAGLKNLLASIEFDEYVVIRKSDVRGIAKRIVSIIAPAATQRLPTLRVNRRDQLPSAIRDVWAHHRANVEQPFVGLAWGGTVSVADETEVLRLIANKEQKLRIYRRHCSQLWLLLLVDPYSAASMAYIPSQFFLRSSGFDRVVAVQSWSYTTELWRAAA